MKTEVHMGNIAIGKGQDTLCARGIGSCVVVTLYCSKKKIGALAHTMLALKSDGKDNRYVDVAICNMLKEMEALGAMRQYIGAKLIGGADMFAAFDLNIGEKNISNAREILKQEGINLIGEVVGGSQGRSVELSIASGIVTVKVRF